MKVISEIKINYPENRIFSVETIFIPRINDDPQDFDTLFRIWTSIHNKQHIEIKFSSCDFLRQNAVAFLGGTISYIRSNGGKVSIDTNSLLPAIKANLEQNGFLNAMGESTLPWDGNSIPYREDRHENYQSISQYLHEKWIGKGWLYIDPELARVIVSNVIEIYSNAFTHASSSNGVYSCGQNYPSLQELKITVIDFGIGIPQSVRDYLVTNGYSSEISDERALQIAFQEGFSTKPELGGMGLKLLKEFIQKNQGRMDIYSHSGHAIVDSNGEKFEPIDSFFKGTVVNISLNRDQKFYYLAEKKSEQPLF